MRSSDYEQASLAESLIQAEVTWLFRRIKQLAQERHRDPYYYFYGHAEMSEPGKPEPARRTIPASQRTRILERDAYRCRGCGSWEALSVDHIVASSRGGTDSDDNLQTLCRPCNSSKGAKSQDEWETSNRVLKRIRRKTGHEAKSRGPPSAVRH